MVDFQLIKAIGGRVNFQKATFQEVATHFNGAWLSGGAINFKEAQFSNANLDLTAVSFMPNGYPDKPSTLDLSLVTGENCQIVLTDAELSAGRVQLDAPEVRQYTIEPPDFRIPRSSFGESAIRRHPPSRNQWRFRRTTVRTELASLSSQLVPDDLWATISSIVDEAMVHKPVKFHAPIDGRQFFAAIALALTTGCPWGQLPASFAVVATTAAQQFSTWTKTGVWHKTELAMEDAQLSPTTEAWTQAILRSAARRCRKPAGT
jgi:transposase